MKRSFSIATIVAILSAGLLAAEAAGPLTPVTSVSLGSSAHDLVLDVGGPDGDFAYVVTDVGLSVVDITNRTAPLVRGSVPLGGIGYGLDRKDKLVFVANVKTGLRVIDVSDPDHPVVVGSKTIPGSGGAREVAIKDDIAYVAGYAGEVHVIRYSRPNPPQVVLTTVKTLGILAWGHPGSDAKSLAKMRQPVASGGGKVTGLSLTGDTMVVPEFAYGRLFFYDVSDADNPTLAGSHDHVFTFRAVINPAQTWAFGFAASSGLSGIYSVPLHLLDPMISTYHNSCTECDYFKSPATDYGGLSVTSNGRYVIYLAGKQGVIQVIDVSDPSNMVNGGSLPIVGHGTRLMETMGAKALEDYIYAAVGDLGFRVYSYLGISD